MKSDEINISGYPTYQALDFTPPPTGRSDGCHYKFYAQQADE
ncbi:MAG TPA: hypothetical protein VIH58_00015 [Chthoniobacterales bacterium]